MSITDRLSRVFESANNIPFISRHGTLARFPFAGCLPGCHSCVAVLEFRAALCGDHMPVHPITLPCPKCKASIVINLQEWKPGRTLRCAACGHSIALQGDPGGEIAGKLKVVGDQLNAKAGAGDAQSSIKFNFEVKTTCRTAGATTETSAPSGSAPGQPVGPAIQRSLFWPLTILFSLIMMMLILLHARFPNIPGLTPVTRVVLLPVFASVWVIRKLAIWQDAATARTAIGACAIVCAVLTAALYSALISRLIRWSKRSCIRIETFPRPPDGTNRT